MIDLDTLLHKATDNAPCTTEADFSAYWQQHISGLDEPFSVAVAGGLQVDNLANVFIAGYQAAIRHCFDLPREQQSLSTGWLTLAVSEDRSTESPLPGVTWQQQQSSKLLNGHKTWIAACNHLSGLIVKAGRGTDACYCLVARDTPGLILSETQNPSFLPDLSQGRASFENLVVHPSAVLNSGRIDQFSATEALMIYTAFSACLWRKSQQSNATLALKSQSLLRLAHTLYTGRNNHYDSTAFQAFDKEIQSLLHDWLTQNKTIETHWQRDKRLIAMYSKGIQAL